MLLQHNMLQQHNVAFATNRTVKRTTKTDKKAIFFAMQ